jgi:hypothetical protein
MPRRAIVLVHLSQARSRPHSRLTTLTSRLQRGARDADGFWFIELLLVALMADVLAAEASGTDESGSYRNVTTVELNGLDPSVRVIATTTEAYLTVAEGMGAEYK